MVRSTSGEVTGLSSQAGWVRLPHGLLQTEEQLSDTGADGSTPALGAGGSRFDSEVSDFFTHGSRGLVAQIRLIRGSR